MWLYQMSEDMWPASQFRATVWEGVAEYWPTRTIRSTDRPQQGDRLLCWYAPTGATMPGIVGWGVILGWFSDVDEIMWRAAPPSDALKMHPLFDDAVRARIDAVRGRFKQATMWPMAAGDAAWFAEQVRTWWGAK